LKHNYSLKSKLLFSFILFSGLILSVLWILQIVFFGNIYRAVRVNSIRTCAEKMDGLSDASYSSFVSDAAVYSDICINVYDEKMNLIAGEHAGGQCVVHNISKKTAFLFYQTTKDCYDQRFESYLPANEIAEMILRIEQSKNPFNNFFGDYSYSGTKLSAEDVNDCVLYSMITENNQGESRYVLLSTVIVPVDSTVQTLRFELFLISFVLILISLFTAFVLSMHISKPIAQLNRSAVELPRGRFQSEGIVGYREVMELSNTLSIAAQEIQKVDDLRKELIANVSHDLRTPLTLISGYSEVMRDIPGENTPENLQIIIDETARLSMLVTDLLDLSKLEAGMEKIERERLEFVDFVRGMLKRYEKMTSLQGYRFALESDVKFVYTYADPIKLGQVIYNLVNNAILYSGDDLTVLVRIRILNDKIRFEVIDHGEGIPEDRLNDIWDRYYRVDKNHKEARVGTGLGLSIVKKILDFHGSDYGVTSKIGEGSCFWFYLPIQDLPGDES